MATWTTDPATGLVTVDFGDGLGPHQPTLSAKEAASFKHLVLDPWGSAITAHAEAVGVPPAHLAGLIWRESGGNANVVSFDGGVGLMQITSKNLKAGHTNDELKDPDLNLSIGAPFFASGWHTNQGDLPRAAAAYNAGSAKVCGPTILKCCNSCCPLDQSTLDYYAAHPNLTPPPCKFCSCNTEWNLVATAGHITNVVAASNTAILSQGIHASDPVPTPVLDTTPPVLIAGTVPSSTTTSTNVLGWMIAAGIAYWGIKTYVLTPQLSRQR